MGNHPFIEQSQKSKPPDQHYKYTPHTSIWSNDIYSDLTLTRPGRAPEWCEIYFGQIYTWVFPKIVVPQNGWFIMEIPIKMDDFGGNIIFSETPTYTLWLLTRLRSPASVQKDPPKHHGSQTADIGHFDWFNTPIAVMVLKTWGSL